MAASGVARTEMEKALQAIGADIKALRAGGPYFKGIIAGGTAVPTGNLPLNAQEDPDGRYNYTTRQYTVPVAGVYRVSTHLKSSSGGKVAVLYKNGSLAVVGGFEGTGTNNANMMVWNVRCAAGDTLAVQPDSAFTTSSDGTGVENTWVTIEYVGAGQATPATALANPAVPGYSNQVRKTGSQSFATGAGIQTVNDLVSTITVQSTGDVFLVTANIDLNIGSASSIWTLNLYVGGGDQGSSVLSNMTAGRYPINKVWRVTGLSPGSYFVTLGMSTGAGTAVSAESGSSMVIEQVAAGLQTTVAGPVANLPEYAGSQNPAPPATGLSLFTRKRGRRMPAFIGPMGQDSQVQAGFHSNKVGVASAQNGIAGLTSSLGLPITALGTASAITNSGSSFYTSLVRTRYATAATAGTAAGATPSNPQWMLSSTPNMGGFFFVCRFGLAVTTTTNRVFVGMTTTTLSFSADPSAKLSLVGLAADAADTQLSVITNDASGTATKYALNSAFDARAAATNFYEFTMFAASGAGSRVDWAVRRLNDGAYMEGTITSDLPALNTPMYAYALHGPGTTASAAAIEIQQMYVESDN